MISAGRARRGVAPTLLALGLASLAPPARAQVDYSGQWRAGVTRMDVAVESWGADCGLRPQSTRSSGGGEVEIVHTGKRLAIRAQGREIRSDACWSANPGLKRIASTANDQQWTTHCKTEADDPRAEEGTYSLQAQGPDELLYRDVSRYNWQLNESKCVATITTTQTLHRVQPTQTAEGPTPAPACVPGEPRRISLTPKRAEIELGGQVCFRARLFDAAGCPLPRAPHLRLEHSQALKGELSGRCFRAGQSSAEAEGEFEVVAEEGALEARARIAVRAADLSALLAKRLGTGALTGFEEDEAPAAAPAPPPPPTAAKIEAGEVRSGSSRRSIAWALLAGVAVLLVAGVVLWLRSRSRVPAATTQDTAPDDVREPAVAPAPPTPSPRPEPASREPWICPTCRQGFPASVGRCPKDGTDLMRYADFVEAKRPDAGPEQTCPKCGTRYPAATKFCGKDGTPLGSDT